MRGRAGASSGLPGWTAGGRALVLALGATSLVCMLAELYGLASMRTTALCLLLPGAIVLSALTFLDWINPASDQRLVRAVLIGAAGGLAAVLASDLVRVPLVHPEWFGLQGHVSALPLFNSMPRRGAMLLGESISSGEFSAGAVVLGWAYHFVNGAMIGVMYMALVGEPRRRTWLWGLAFASCLQMIVLGTPYARVFSVELTQAFVAASLAAHGALGLALGGLTRWLAGRWEPGEAWAIFAEE